MAVFSLPQYTFLTSVIIFTGVAFDVVVPSPNFPYPLEPHIHKLPSFFKIAVCHVPALTDATFVIIFTGVA